MEYNTTISNMCTSSFIYRHYNVQFDHPLVYCLIKPKDFYNLVVNYKNIDYNNIKIELVNNPWVHHSQRVPHITIDNLINVYYGHYIYEKNVTKPTIIQNVNVIYCDILEWTRNKYFERLKRFDVNKPCLFIEGLRHRLQCHDNKENYHYIMELYKLNLDNVVFYNYDYDIKMCNKSINNDKIYHRNKRIVTGDHCPLWAKDILKQLNSKGITINLNQNL